MVSPNLTISAFALQSPGTLLQLKAALCQVELSPLLALDPPRRGRGRRKSSRLPMLRAYLISRYPGAGVSPEVSRLRRQLQEDDSLREACGFGERIPVRDTFIGFFTLLDDRPGLVDAFLALVSQRLSLLFPQDSAVVAPARPEPAVKPRLRYGDYIRRRRATRMGLEEAMDLFGSEADAEGYFIEWRWPDGVCCLRCGSVNVASRMFRKPQPFRCRDCRYDFSVRTGTLMHGSNLPLRKWALALYLVSESPKGISALALSDKLKIGHGTALHLLHRIRAAFPEDLPLFTGPVQADEVYLGGRERNKHASKKRRAGRGTVGKAPVLGALDEASNRIALEAVNSVRGVTVRDFLRRLLTPGCALYTDQHATYLEVPGVEHHSVNHGEGEYYRDGVTTNAIESVWALLRRVLMGTYHQVSWKHLPRYLAEHSWRHNCRGRTVLERMKDAVRNMAGRRLTLKEMRRGGRDNLKTVAAVGRPLPPQLELWPAWAWP